MVLGLTWASGEPELRVRDIDPANPDAVSRLEPLVGQVLNYRTGPDVRRWCLGRTPFRAAHSDHYDCRERPEPGSRLCRRCSISDATFASNLHHAHTKDRADIDPAIAEHLRQRNVLYLAAFRDGSVKVGTSTEHRRMKRLAEQGAWCARIVASTVDGYAVRDIEDRVTAEVDIPQSVSIGRKIDGMAAPVPQRQLDATLDVLAAAVDDVRTRMADRRIEAADDRWVFPHADEPRWARVQRYPAKLGTGQHDLDVVDACGRMAMVQRRGTADVFVADIGQLYGFELDCGDYESDELAVQGSLF